MAHPFVPQALPPTRSSTYEGPLGEHDGEFEALPCVRCGSLTGLVLTTVSADEGYGRRKLLCIKCLTILRDDQLVERVEERLKGPDIVAPLSSPIPISSGDRVSFITKITISEK